MTTSQKMQPQLFFPLTRKDYKAPKEAQKGFQTFSPALRNSTKNTPTPIRCTCTHKKITTPSTVQKTGANVHSYKRLFKNCILSNGFKTYNSANISWTVSNEFVFLFRFSSSYRPHGRQFLFFFSPTWGKANTDFAAAMLMNLKYLQEVGWRHHGLQEVGGRRHGLQEVGRPTLSWNETNGR